MDTIGAAPVPVRDAGGFWGLSRYQWTVFVAAWLGWGFDVFDGLLFTFVAPVCVPRLLSVAAGDPSVRTATGAITAILLVGWATGGILFGVVADRIGRARTLLLTMLTYAVATAAGAVASSVWMLGAFRFVAALGIGGEWAAGASLVAEVVPEHRRISMGALLFTSAPLGILLASLVNDLFTKRLGPTAVDPDLAWRFVFLSGLIPAFFTLWIRRRVHEPTTWQIARVRTARVRDLFAADLRHATLGGLAMSIVTLVTWWATNAFLPFVVQHLAGPGASESTVAGWVTYASVFFNVGGVIGMLATIPAARLGARRFFALYLSGAALAIWGTFHPAWDPVTRVRLLFFDGLTVFGVVASFSFYLPELFPTRLRATGSGFCFNTGRYLAAAGPYVVGVALGSASTPMQAIRWVALVPLVGLLMVPFIAERRSEPVSQG